MNYAQFSIMLILLPLLSFVVLGIWGHKYFRKASGLAGTLVIAVITALACYAAWRYFFVDGRVGGSFQPIIALQAPWLNFGQRNLSIDMGILIDPISVMMLVVITVVSLMVHVFSLGYMKYEDRYSTYFAFLALFTFSMLGLVVSVNLFQLYIFWELVGVSSYLLIGFFFNRPAAVAASKKAFIVTRFADLGFLIGILMLGNHTGTFDINGILEQAVDPGSPGRLSFMAAGGFMGVSALTWALTLVFVGGAGKSAMFPLHIWLPDAMEGPTPVSALIHAATMVVAGVYLVARLFPLFQLDESAMSVVAWVGVLSSVFAAVIACTQSDIKRVLAYSTMSQIGYMMFALGISGYGGEEGLGFSASMFHLFTHAFFKSLLFLGAGAVIHVVHSNDMRDMGGLRRFMPVTHITFLVACLAIAGIPPLSGFFSKEEILLAAWNHHKVIYVLALFTAALTAFYMFRLYYAIFWKNDKSYLTPHGEGTWTMKLPLVVLALLTLVTGFVPFSDLVTSDGKPLEHHFSLAFSLAPVALVIAGLALATFLYKTQNTQPEKWAHGLGRIYRTAMNKFYIDELYMFITKYLVFRWIALPAAWVDRHVVDGMINGIGAGAAKLSQAIRGLQSGKVQAYALWMLGGVLLLAVMFIYLWN